MLFRGFFYWNGSKRNCLEGFFDLTSLLQGIELNEIHRMRFRTGSRKVVAVKTWQCVLLSVAVHGLIFGLPVMPNTPPDSHTEEIQLLVLEPPPVDIPVEKIPEPVIAHKSAEPPERLVPPAQQPKREPPVPRKKPVSVPKPVQTASVPKISPDSDTSSNKPPETAEEVQAVSPAAESASAGSSPPDDSSVHSGGRNVGGHDHENAVESSVGDMGGPQFIQRSVPKYPRMAQRLGMEGSVLLRLAIDASGKLTGVEVLNGAGNGFDEEAVQAVKRSTFAPAVLNGRPVRCLALLKIRFQLSSE
jgi:periplasmic protein TonB